MKKLISISLLLVCITVQAATVVFEAGTTHATHILNYQYAGEACLP
jgi:hypothetical protein